MIRFLIVLLIIACIAPLVIKGPDSEPIMTLDDWKIEWPASMSDLLPVTAQDKVSSDKNVVEPTTVYRWQDENGRWHFSTVSPDTQAAEVMELDGNINIMDAYVPRETAPDRAHPKEEIVGAGSVLASQQQVSEVMETVNNLQTTIDLRKADIDAIAQPALDNKKN